MVVVVFGEMVELVDVIVGMGDEVVQVGGDVVDQVWFYGWCFFCFRQWFCCCGLVWLMF